MTTRLIVQFDLDPARLPEVLARISKLNLGAGGRMHVLPAPAPESQAPAPPIDDQFCYFTFARMAAPSA